MNENRGKQIAVLLAAVLVLVVGGLWLNHKHATTIRPAGPDALIPDKSEVVFTTSFGPLVFQLYPNLAPQHVAQFLKLVAAGVYEGATVIRIEKDFVIQIDATYARPTPLKPEQTALITSIPAEFSDVKHVRHILSMARYDDVDSATASFSVLLGTAPHLDGHYTVFGRMLDSSDDTLKKIEAQPVVTGTTKPATVIPILKTEIRPRTP